VTKDSNLELAILKQK